MANEARDELAGRLRKIIGAGTAIGEIRMFGGLCFTLNGNMQIAARHDGSLLVRVGAKKAEAAVKKAGVSRMVMRGKEMADYLYVDADQLDDKTLNDWVRQTREFVETLPRKKASAKRAKA